jgi:hypothetical protein
MAWKNGSGLFQEQQEYSRALMAILRKTTDNLSQG